MRLKDLTNKKFGKLIVLRRGTGNAKNCVYWECVCDCGNTLSVISSSLLKGHTTSCGCNVRGNVIHGLCHTKEYAIWKAMRQRCNNKNAQNYNRYGGRGIKICEEWNDFVVFYEWCKQSGYKDGLTIERIDYNKDYSPDNCKCATRLEQGNNKSNNRLITFNGKTLTLMGWERATCINHATIARRIDSGWSINDALTIPAKRGNRIMI